MEKKERFSLRKYKSGMVSVLIGILFLTGIGSVAAEEQGVSSAHVSAEQHQESREVLSVSQTSERIAVNAQDANSQSSKAEAKTEEATEPGLVPFEMEALTQTNQSVKQQEESRELPPVNMDTHRWIKTEGAWNRGYKGQGKIIAVIDTGIDASHHAMRITNPAAAKFTSKADIDQRKKAAGIQYGVWLSDKVVFAHNYVENNDKVKEIKDDPFEGLDDLDFDVIVQQIDIRRNRPQSIEAPQETVIKLDDTSGGTIIDWQDTDDDSKYESHGMHVTGIAAGNGLKAAAAGERFLGIAPEAQVMFMRVFTHDLMGTGDPLFIKAIEDAVALGADVINLSLGSANGSQLNGNRALMAAIEKARQAGVSVVVAAGNERAFGSDHADPLVTNPDYGLVGAPSAGRTPTSVASINNKVIIERLMTVEGLKDRADLNHGKAIYTESIDFKDIKTSLGFDVPYSFVYVKDLTKEGYQEREVSGKIVLVQRDPNRKYDDIIAEAKQYGAVGVLIFNNEPGKANRTMRLSSKGMVLPSAFIFHEFGMAMAALNGDGTGTLTFDAEVSKAISQKGNEMNYFSNWGLTSDGYLKPDITAPGGDIYSTFNDDHYGSQSGTSMATPHIAGASLLVKQYLEALQPQLAKDKLADLVKNILMSNAQIHINPKTNTTTSPRQQGAGLLNIEAAVTSGLYLTGRDNYGSISLGNVTDQISFEVTIHNLSNQAKSLRYQTELLTDQVDTKEGRFALRSRSLKTYQGEQVDVPAQGHKTITITLDASNFTEELSKQMPNGYYLEGFVRFVDSKDEHKDNINIPFVGFKGAFENLPVVEASIYELKAQGKTGFYFDSSGLKDEIYVGNHFTGLVTVGTDTNVSMTTIADNGLHTLGTFRNKDGKFVLERNAVGYPVLAISPNGDNNQDFAAFKGVFLRKYQGLQASVYKATDTDRKELLWTSPSALQGDKNFNSDIRFAKSTTLLETGFSGKSLTGADLPDGKYHYVISYYPDVVGAKRQEMVFEVIVDRQKPELGTASYNPVTHRFRPSQWLDRGQAGILRDSVFYLETKDDKPYKITINDSLKYVTVSDNKQFVEHLADGSFVLPVDQVALGDFYYMVEDFAGNVAIAKLGNHLPERIGQAELALTLTDINAQHQLSYSDNLNMTAADTGLVTNEAELLIISRNRPQSRLAKLGQTAVISPNDDGNKDFVAFKGLPHQVYQDLKVTVFAQEDTAMTSPIWSSQPGASVANVDSTAWYGTRASGARVMSGHYRYVVSYLDANGMPQIEIYAVTVSHQKPAIAPASFQADGAIEVFRPGPSKGQSPIGIVREEVFYLVKKDGRKFDLTVEDQLIRFKDNKVMIAKNADGTYTIPKVEGVAEADYYYLVEDEAGQIAYMSLAALRAVGPDKGVVSVALALDVLENKKEPAFTYLIRDEQGKPIEQLDYFNSSANSLILPFGRYTVELLAYDNHLFELRSDNLVSFSLDADTRLASVAFEMTRPIVASVWLLFNQVLPEGSRVSLKAANGQLISLAPSLYVPSAYGKTLRQGSYEVLVELPEGYQLIGQGGLEVSHNGVIELTFEVIKAKQPQLEHQAGGLTHYTGSSITSSALTAQAVKKAQALPSTGEQAAVNLVLLGFLSLGAAGSCQRQKKY